jgi:outer membrane protein assembly factor BamD (BamD/ComL family)
MKRYREAALLLQSVVSSYPTSPFSELASYHATRCWYALKDWPNTILAAEDFEIRFVESKHAAEIERLKNKAKAKLVKREI